MRVSFCIFQKVPRELRKHWEMQENRTELCSTLSWVKGISTAVAAAKSWALIYTKKRKFLTQAIPAHRPQTPL